MAYTATVETHYVTLWDIHTHAVKWILLSSQVSLFLLTPMLKIYAKNASQEQGSWLSG